MSRIDVVDGASPDNLVRPRIMFLSSTTTNTSNTDEFYIVKSGEFAYEKHGKKLTEKLAGKGDSFGELALLYHSPRACDVKCVKVIFKILDSVWSEKRR